MSTMEYENEGSRYDGKIIGLILSFLLAMHSLCSSQMRPVTIATAARLLEATGMRRLVIEACLPTVVAMHGEHNFTDYSARRLTTA